MATAYGSSASNTHSGGGPLVITKPTGLAAGDLMIACIGVSGNAANDIALTGWTTLFTTNDGNNYGLRALYKVATSGDAAATNFTFTIGASAGDGVAGFIVRITGAGFMGAGNIRATSDLNTAVAGSQTFTPGITPQTSSSLYILGSFLRGPTNQGSYAITNNNPTWTEREDIFVNTTDDAAIGFATASATSASATGDYSISVAGSAEGIGFLISVNESLAAAGSTALLAPDTTLFTMTGSNGATGTIALLNPDAILFSLSGEDQTSRWTNSLRGTGTWTNEER